MLIIAAHNINNTLFLFLLALLLNLIGGPFICSGQVVTSIDQHNQLDIGTPIVHFTDGHATITMPKPQRKEIERIGLCRRRSKLSNLWRRLSTRRRKSGQDGMFEKDCIRAHYNPRHPWIIVDIQNSRVRSENNILDARGIRSYYIGMFGGGDGLLVGRSTDFKLIVDYNVGSVDGFRCADDQSSCSTRISSMQWDMRYIAIVKSADGSKVLHRVLGRNNLTESQVSFQFKARLREPYVFEIVQRKVWWKSHFADSRLIFRKMSSSDDNGEDLQKPSSFSITLSTSQYYTQESDKTMSAARHSRSSSSSSAVCDFRDDVSICDSVGVLPVVPHSVRSPVTVNSHPISSTTIPPHSSLHNFPNGNNNNDDNEVYGEDEEDGEMYKTPPRSAVGAEAEAGIDEQTIIFSHEGSPRTPPPPHPLSPPYTPPYRTLGNGIRNENDIQNDEEREMWLNRLRRGGRGPRSPMLSRYLASYASIPAQGAYGENNAAGINDDETINKKDEKDGVVRPSRRLRF